MKLLNSVLVTVILFHCDCSLVCKDDWSETEFGKVECIQNESGSVENQSYRYTSMCGIDIQNITWKISHSESGQVTAEFNLLPKSCNSVLKLYVDETLSNEDECNKITSLHLHSERDISIEDFQIPNRKPLAYCGKTQSVTFQYVYTGCYVLDCQGDISVSKFLKTAYKKDLLVNKIPSIIPQYTSSKNELLVTLIDTGKINITKINFELKKCGLYQCPCDDTLEFRSWEIALSQSEEFMCKVIHDEADAYSQPECFVENEKISCAIENVTAGYYCIMAELPSDDRCRPTTVWNPDGGNICLFNSFPFNATEVPPTYPAPPYSTPEIWWILVVVFTTLAVACLCILMYFLRMRRPRPEPDLLHFIEVTPSLLMPRIFLLYPRDCELFMRMMTTFRELLKNITKFEVCDCYDPELMEEVAYSKQDWIKKYLSHPDVKVVVAETECSTIQQKAHFRHMNIGYKEPTWLDPLFLYGLKALTDKLEKNMYQRVFVIRFYGFTEESFQLNHLTPYTRYIIPQHLEKLLKALYQQYSINESIENKIQKLQEDIKTLENYKKQRPDYLDSLLFISR